MVILIIIIFVLLILVHEYGHFLAARRNGVEVEEFGIGFPPKLYGYKPKDSETEYTLNLLPLGGFVRLKGESSTDKGPGTFGGASFKNKTKILMAGVGMNLLAAAVILTGLAFVGLPQFIENQFSIPADERIVQDDVMVVTATQTFPLAKAGVDSGDVIEKVGDYDIEESSQLYELDDEFVGQTAEVVYRENDERITKSVQFPTQEEILFLYIKQSLIERLETNAAVEILSVNGEEFTIEGAEDVFQNNKDKQVEVTYQEENTNEEATTKISLEEQIVEDTLKVGRESGPFGITPTDVTVKRYTWAAPIVGIGLTLQLTWLTFAGVLVTVGHLFTGAVEQASQNVTGPIGIFVLLNRFTSLGIQFVLYFMAVISVALAVMNALPIPALDGGRLALIAGFKAFKKELTEKIESRVHTIGFLLLMLLVVVLSYVDINRFF